MHYVKAFFRILKKKLVLTALVLALQVGAVYFVVHTLNKPAVGVINQTIDQSDSVATTELKEFKNKYFTTKYPGRYDLQANKNKSASLDSWILVAHQSIGGFIASNIAINVNKLPDGGVKEDSDYKMFEAYPKIYTISRATYNFDSVIFGSKTDTNYIKTALWTHDKYLLTISISAGEKTSQLESEMDTILSKLTWFEQ